MFCAFTQKRILLLMILLFWISTQNITGMSPIRRQQNSSVYVLEIQEHKRKTSCKIFKGTSPLMSYQMIGLYVSRIIFFNLTSLKEL